jgi:hypothetical protein
MISLLVPVLAALLSLEANLLQQTHPADALFETYSYLIGGCDSLIYFGGSAIDFGGCPIGGFYR